MSSVSDKMGLIKWDSVGDYFSHTGLAANFETIDEHDHTVGKGVKIPNGGLAAGSVGSSEIQDGSVLTAKIGDGQVTPAKLSATAVTASVLDPTLAGILGVSSGGVIHRGKSIIATNEIRSSNSYGVMTTPDRVTGVVLPTDGLIFVLYQATWKESVVSQARAALFLNSNQVHVATPTSNVVGVEANSSGANANVYSPLVSMPTGLASLNSSGGGYPGDVTTGQVVGLASGTNFWGGPCCMFAAAGTYDVSVQFKMNTGGGSVTVQNRNLWVLTLGF